MEVVEGSSWAKGVGNRDTVFRAAADIDGPWSGSGHVSRTSQRYQRLGNRAIHHPGILECGAVMLSGAGTVAGIANT